ncbi:MAG: peptidoglycan editing factor PgeF [Desulfobacterota bacterium]|nr:peptidoglycan editing factor PgeF [Thermodesulfobacteriota bacterium]MDW8002104.1 peptidoglycan editing factor PgeF [Deltaproteobacteria bacterium]
MSYSSFNAGPWEYLSVPCELSPHFVYGFFTKRGPDLKDPKDASFFLEVFSLKRFVVMNQEHSDRINIIKNGENPQTGDALVVLERNVAALVKSADCCPIVLMDPKHEIAAVIHAGYKGTLKRIAEKTVKVMEDLGSEPKDLYAVVGPSIGRCCYNVGDEVFSLFLNEFGYKDYFSFFGGRIYLDLRKLNIFLLSRVGVSKIEVIDLCTFCNSDTFYSHRRGDKDKRQISFVIIK